MDLRKVEEIVKDSKGGIIEKKDAIMSTLLLNNNSNSNNHSPEASSSSSGREGGVVNIHGDPTTTTTSPAATTIIDSASALQLFLDHIPISSITGIHNSPSTVVVVRTQDSVKSGIRMLYENNASGALIVDNTEPDPTKMLTTSFSHPYVGFISFSNMVLWSLQEYKKHQSGIRKDHALKKIKPDGFFSMLDRIPVSSEAKIGELAASFLWNPVFPVKLDQTIFHVLLLLSKHRLSVVPVTEHSSSKVVGYVTEDSINHILLQSSGLEWFDSIADKPLSDFRFEYNNQIVSVYNDQKIAEAVHMLWTNKVCAIAVEQRHTQKLIGCLRYSDVYRLLDDDSIFSDKEDTSIEQFIHRHTDLDRHDANHELGTLTSAGTLALHNKFEPRMDSPVTNTETDTLKQVMTNLSEKKSNFSFLVDGSGKVEGMVTIRDILMEFAPPSMDSRIDGGGFFDTALKESGCIIRDGTMVHL